MAQSRLEKFANIFVRMEGFIKTGVVKVEDKPVWFDVCKTFPPHVMPDWQRALPDVKLKPILYHEDKIRAEFYRVFGSPGLINLMDPSKKPISELFIESYIEAAQSSELEVDDVTLFKMAANRLRSNGIRLRPMGNEDSTDLTDNTEKRDREQKKEQKIRKENKKSRINIEALMDDDI